jgi:hypothetical protein
MEQRAASGEWRVASGRRIVVFTWILGLCALFMVSRVHVAYSQSTDSLATRHSPLAIDYYLRLAHPVGTVKLDFPGPNGGFTFVHLPTEEVRPYWGDTLVHDHTYLLDLNVSNDGLYLAPDTMVSFSSTTPFVFDMPSIAHDASGHIIHANLTPGHSHQELLALDSNFNGTIGYGLMKQFVTAFDFKRNQLTFYPLYASDSIADDDTNVIQLPILDDAKITYCHCNAPTIWLDVEAPPLPQGHVNLAFQAPQSEIFKPSLDSATREIIDKNHARDSLAGKTRPIGLNLAQFIIHDVFGHAINLAPRGPHRMIDPMPKIYHDFNVPVMGALGTDVLRTFSGIIIDPSRGRLIFVK